MGDSAAQLLAIRRGDIDIAFNLIPEQVATLKGDANVRLEPLASLDFVYMALTQNPEFNKALAVKEARQAIGYAIDYDGIKNALLGGAALAAGALPADRRQRLDRGDREADRLPRGPRQGEGAARQGRFRRRLRVRDQLRQRRRAGVSYQLLARRSSPTSAASASRRSSRRSTRSTCAPQYTTGKSPGRRAHLLESAGDRELALGRATVERVAKRVHWTPPEDLVKLVHQAAGESDQKKQAELWVE